MFLKILLNYLIGYVNIKVEGYFIERFINICISKKILLWNMKRNKSTILYANISIKDYKRLREISKKTKSRINIEKKKGIPFFLHRYRKRKIFMFLLLFVFMLLIITSNFIWNIEIKGCTSINANDIIEELKESGLKIGSNKRKIDTNSIINKVRLDRNDIAWMGINIKGTNAIVEIKEVDKAPEIINENDYCKIVSDKNAVITKMNVRNGMTIVGVGDIVKEGDVLVEGYLEGQYSGIRYVHAEADIEAKVWYSKKGKLYFNQEIKVPTGATENKYSIEINNFKINFYKTLSKFQNYDTINKDRKLMLFSNFYLPIKLEKITNYEYKKEMKTFTEDELIRNSNGKNRTRTTKSNRKQKKHIKQTNKHL